MWPNVGTQDAKDAWVDLSDVGHLRITTLAYIGTNSHVVYNARRIHGGGGGGDGGGDGMIDDQNVNLI